VSLFAGTARIIEALGLNVISQHDSFARQWRLSEFQIIMVAGEDAGWLQVAQGGDAICPQQLYLTGPFSGALDR
jgi:hypothetical protein